MPRYVVNTPINDGKTTKKVGSFITGTPDDDEIADLLALGVIAEVPGDTKASKDDDTSRTGTGKGSGAKG